MGDAGYDGDAFGLEVGLDAVELEREERVAGPREAQDLAGAVEVYAELCGASGEDVREQVLGFVREHLAKGLLVWERGGASG